MRGQRFLVPLLAVLIACKGAQSSATAKPDFDSDPLALLPPSATVMARIDANTILHADPEGRALSGLVDGLVPVGAEANFEAGRDLDRIVIGEYGLTGTDVSAVLSGRFDLDKIATAAKTKTGVPITPGKYAGFATFTAGNVMYAPLTSHTVIVGTGDGVRRILDRAQSGPPARAIAAWAADTLQTQSAEFALVADLSGQSVATLTVGSVSIPWLKGMQVARILGDLDPSGLNVAATLTYADPGQAANAQEGVHMLANWLKIIGPLVGGVTVQNLQVRTQASDVSCSFVVDDQTLHTLVGLAPRFIPGLSAP